MSIMVDKPDGIAFFQMLAIRGRLQIEVRTGLRSSVSTLKAAKTVMGVFSNTKAGALAEVEAFIAGMEYAKGVISELDATEVVADTPRKWRAKAKAAFRRGFNRYHELAKTPGYVPQ